MKKRVQNRIATSRFTLWVSVAASVALWLTGGLLGPVPGLPVGASWTGAWMPFGCFLLTVQLMAVLNNSNALIRIYSRSVASAFVVLMCAGNFLLGSASGAFVQLCMVLTYLLLFRTYQDRQTAGKVYYAFLCVGLTSLFCVHLLWFVPVWWLLMHYQLSSLSWRTFFASVLGVLTPYWLALPAVVFFRRPDALAAHFATLAEVGDPLAGLAALSVNEVAFYLFVVALGLTGSIHHERKRSGDNVRIQLLYDCFMVMFAAAAVVVVILPRHYDVLVRLMVVNVAPLIAHFVTLTSTRVTNIAFHFICAAALALTLLSLWTPSLSF